MEANNIKKTIKENKCLTILGTSSFIFSLYTLIISAHQPLVDAHAFRQSQTALTSYWLVKNGFSLAYETPVAGYPWSIPFEFPVYQSIVAAISYISKSNVVVVGRLISYVFFVLTAIPVFYLIRKTNISAKAFLVFCAVYFSSPLYVYWSRTVMIETTALFFTVLSLLFAQKIITNRPDIKNTMSYTLAAILAVLCKATTFGPIALLLVIVTMFKCFNKYEHQRLNLLASRLIVLSFPIIIGLLWAHYSDSVKMLNEFGKNLTSSSLHEWNYGSLSQKLSFKTWCNILIYNDGGVDWYRFLNWFGLSFLLPPLCIIAFKQREKMPKEMSYFLIFMGSSFFANIAIFTNLHLVHNYYQTSCAIYLIIIFSVLTVFLMENTSYKKHLLVLVAFCFLLNIVFFKIGYAHRLLPSSSVATRVGNEILITTPTNSAFVIFGNDWCSDVTYYSNRKSFAVPDWFNDIESVWSKPENYIGNVPLGAIVVVKGSKFASNDKIRKKAADNPEWTLKETDDAYFLYPTLKN